MGKEISGYLKKLTISVVLICFAFHGVIAFAAEPQKETISIISDTQSVSIEYYQGKVIEQTETEDEILIRIPEGIVPEQIEIHTGKGGIEIDGVIAEKYLLETVEGDINVYLPENTAFHLQLSSISELFESDFLYDVTSKKQEYVFGENGVDIVIETIMGTARVQTMKAEAEGTQESEKDKQVIACIGDSITAAGYPEELAGLLGEGYEVLNYGQPGSQLLSGERFSYTSLDAYQESLECMADSYILMLGSNDTMDAEKWDAVRFTEEYQAFLDSYLASGDDVNVYVMIPPCVFKTDNARTLSARINLDILDEEVCPIIAEIAEAAGVPVIDLHTLTAGHEEWFADGLHPNEEGNQAIAAYIQEAVFSERTE